MTTLDEWMEVNNVSVDVVKCVTEGHAWKVINGAAKTLAKHRPLLLLSIYHHPAEYMMDLGCDANL
jgi:hypothetical protein